MSPLRLNNKGFTLFTLSANKQLNIDLSKAHSSCLVDDRGPRVGTQPSERRSSNDE